MVTNQLLPIFRYFYRHVLAVAIVTFVAGSVLFAVLSASAVMVEADIVPSFPSIIWMLLLAIPASWTVVIPISACTGVALGMQRWRKEGGWLAFQTSGLCGRDLLRPLVVFAIWVSVITTVVGMWVEPLGRDLSRQTYRDSVATMMLIENRPVTIGESVLVAGEYVDGWYQGVVVRGPEMVSYASRGRVVRVDNGLGLELLDGSLVSLDSPSLRVLWKRWVLEFPSVVSGRTELDERTLPNLWAQARRTEEAGGDASYEWAVVYKRFIHPICSFLLVVGILPLGLGRYPGASVGLLTVGYVAAVRIGDALVPGFGAAVGASSGLMFALVVVGATWVRWKDA